MTSHAKGEFEVNLVPQTSEREIPLFGRMTIDKQFTGDLIGSSKGEMLAARTTVPDSAGYVAMERIEGTLNGRKGSFFLQHSGVTDHGAQALTVTVVPDSGTEELIGLTGILAITITDDKHFYDFEYSLPTE